MPHSTQLTIGTDKHSVPNAIYDGINRLVCSFPDHTRSQDTRKGSPSTPQTIAANARLIAAAPELLEALSRIINHVAHYASMPHAHSDAHKDFAFARSAIAAATTA